MKLDEAMLKIKNKINWSITRVIYYFFIFCEMKGKINDDFSEPQNIYCLARNALTTESTIGAEENWRYICCEWRRKVEFVTKINQEEW